MPEHRTHLLKGLLDLLDRTCDLAASSALDQRYRPQIAECRATIASLAAGHTPDLTQMQDLLTAAGQLNIHPSFAADYAMGRSPDPDLVPLIVDQARQPLTIAAPTKLLSLHDLVPDRTALVHLRFTANMAPCNDLILIERGQISEDGSCVIVTEGANSFLRKCALVGSYRILTCDYGPYSHCRLHRLEEEDGVTPLGRAVATVSGAPLPELGEAQNAEFELIRDSWKTRQKFSR